MTQAANEINGIVKQYGVGGAEYQILIGCREQWYPDLQMITYCTKQQIVTYRLRQEEFQYPTSLCCP